MTEPISGMHRLAVGERYNATLATIPDGTANWRFTTTGVELLLGLSRPSSTEIRDVKTGLAQFALLSADHVLMMAHRFGTMPWSDAPWEASRQRLAGEEPGLIEVTASQHLMIQVVLVDADSGVVRAVRHVSWNHAFVEAVRAAIQRQLAVTGDPSRAQAQIQSWYGRYPDTQSLAAGADIRCDGGR